MNNTKETFDPAGLKNDIDDEVHGWLQTMTTKPARRMVHSGCYGGVIWFAVARKNNDIDVYLGQLINDTEKSFQKVYTAKDMYINWDHWFAQLKVPLWEKNLDCRKALRRVENSTVSSVDWVCEGFEEYTWIQCVDDHVRALTPFELYDARDVYFPSWRKWDGLQWANGQGDSQYSSFYGFARIGGKFHLLRVNSEGMLNPEELKWVGGGRTVRQNYATMHELYRLDADMSKRYDLDEYKRRTAFKSFDDKLNVVHNEGFERRWCCQDRWELWG